MNQQEKGHTKPRPRLALPPAHAIEQQRHQRQKHDRANHTARDRALLRRRRRAGGARHPRGDGRIRRQERDVVHHEREAVAREHLDAERVHAGGEVRRPLEPQEVRLREALEELRVGRRDGVAHVRRHAVEREAQLEGAGDREVLHAVHVERYTHM